MENVKRTPCSKEELEYNYEYDVENSVFQLRNVEYVGSYLISGKPKESGNVEFAFVKKPNFINRFFCRILLGWYWKDY